MRRAVQASGVCSVTLTGTCIITNSGCERIHTLTTDLGPKSLKEFNSILCWAKNFVVNFFFNYVSTFLIG